MIYYVLERKRDGARMPSIEGKQRAGYTWEEFTKLVPPRLFSTARGASNALTWWLKGNYRLKTFVIDTFYGPDVEVDEATIPKPDRGARDDYEVVPVEVKRAKAAR